MNGDDNEPDLNDFEPSFLSTGGVSGGQGQYYPQEDLNDWSIGAGTIDSQTEEKTAVWSRQNQEPEDFIGSGTSTLSVQGDSGFVDNVDHIQFTIADPCVDSINVLDGGGGVAIVEIPALPPPGGGTQVFGSVDSDCQWIDTTTC